MFKKEIIFFSCNNDLTFLFKIAEIRLIGPYPEPYPDAGPFLLAHGYGGREGGGWGTRGEGWGNWGSKWFWG